MGILKRAFLTGVMSASLIALVGGSASAGGPTSVLVVNPGAGTTGSLYTTDVDYSLLQNALDNSGVDTGNEPPAFGDGPGSPSTINVTWLVHDVHVWRVDRLNVHTDGTVWVRTNDALASGDGTIDWEALPDWQQVSDSAAVLEVLDRMGVLDPADARKASAVQNAGSEEDVAAAAANSGSASPSQSTAAWWALPAAMLGLLIGLIGRPYLATHLTRRERGQRQQLFG
jgi:hypothetical protein